MCGDPHCLTEHKELGWRRGGLWAPDDWRTAEELIAAGWAEWGRDGDNGCRYLFATDAGVAAASEHRAAEQAAAGLRRWVARIVIDGHVNDLVVVGKSRAAARWAAIDGAIDSGWPVPDALATVESVRLAR